MSLRFVTSAIAAAIIAGSVLMPAPTAQASEPFSKQQKNELHNIIRNYLLDNPEILNEMVTKLQTAEREQQAQAAQVAISENAKTLFRDENDFVAGNPEGNVTMVEFFDYNCHFCKQSLADVLRLAEEDKNVRIVMKEFPILSEGSNIASQAAIASKKQGKYWEFHLALMAAHGSVQTEDEVMAIAKEVGLDTDKLKADMVADAAEINTQIEANRKLATTIGIQGTPAFVVDGLLIPGALPYDQLTATIQAVRDNGGCQYC